MICNCQNIITELEDYNQFYCKFEKKWKYAITSNARVFLLLHLFTTKIVYRKMILLVNITSTFDIFKSQPASKSL